ncbi:MAG: galactokinase [Ferruginibacter sp.]|jgi:galactokinase
MNSIAVTVLNRFRESFTSEPTLYFSPGRINLIGEHVDYNDGFVLPAAIDKGVYYAVAPNDSDNLNFIAVDFDETLSVAVADIQKMSNWKNYVLSVVNEFLLLGVAVKGFDCVFAGDIPRGSGMSSSAAVEGGLAFALNEMLNTKLNRVELALLCQRAEHNYPHVNCGIMDQYANMMGHKDEVIMLDCKTIQHQYFPLRLQGCKIVLINSKVHHTLASGEYNIRRHRCEEGMAVLKSDLGIQSFRDINDVDALMPFKDKMEEKVFNCCLYVVEEIARAKKAASLLQQDDLASFGKLMYATHEGLSKLYEVSCDELDFLVELAKQDDGVIGARLMGGGFGGCTINIVKDDAITRFIETTSKAYYQKFNIEPEAYIVSTGDGTKQIAITP